MDGFLVVILGVVIAAMILVNVVQREAGRQRTRRAIGRPGDSGDASWLAFDGRDSGSTACDNGADAGGCDGGGDGGGGGD